MSTRAAITKTLRATAVVGTVFFGGQALADEANWSRIALPPFTGMSEKKGEFGAKLGFVSVEHSFCEWKKHLYRRSH